MILPYSSDRNDNREDFDAWRQRLLDETSRFIEWGLAHPEVVQQIPNAPVGKANFSTRARTLFWSVLFSSHYGPAED